MAINRYDSGSVSTYTPRSLEETLLVPMMKRKQHETAADNLNKMRAELGKIDPLTEHLEEAQAIKAALNERIAKQAEQLAKEGFTMNTDLDVMNTNRELQDLFSPTGRAGQINASKIVHNKNYEDFKKVALENEIPSSRISDLWAEKKKKSGYTGYSDTGDITDMPYVGTAAKQDYMKDVLAYNSIIGQTMNEFSNKGYKPSADGLYLENSEHKRIYIENIPQVKEARKGIAYKWLDPNGEGAKYAQEAGLNITPEKVDNDFRAQYKTSSTEIDEISGQPLPGSGEGGDVPDYTMYEQDYKYTDSVIKDMTYREKKAMYEKLEREKNTDGGKSFENTTMRIRLGRVLKHAQKVASGNNEYNKLVKEEDETLDRALKATYSDYGSVSPKLVKATADVIKKKPDWIQESIDGSYMVDNRYKDKIPAELRGHEKKIVFEANKLKNAYRRRSEEMMNDLAGNSNVSTTFYNIAPRTPSAKANLALVYDTVEKTISQGGGLNGINNLGLLTSVIGSDGDEKVDVSKDDAQGLVNLMREEGVPGSLDMSGFSIVGPSEYPEVRFTFRTKDNAKGYDLDGSLGDNNGVIGEGGKPVTFQMTLNKLSHIPKPLQKGEKSKNVYTTGNALELLYRQIYVSGGSRAKDMITDLISNLTKQEQNRFIEDAEEYKKQLAEEKKLASKQK